MSLSLVDLSGKPVRPNVDTVTVRLTCTNGDLPSRLPFGNERGDLDLEGAAPIKRIVMLKKPTGTIRPPTGRNALWRLISHLSLNYLSLVEDGREALQQILKLYNFTDSAYIQKQIEGITSWRARRHFARVISENGVSFARGTRVKMELDEEQFVGGGVYLFASVIERFLALIRLAEQLQPAGATHHAEKGGIAAVATTGGTQDSDVTAQSADNRARPCRSPPLPARPEIWDALEREPYCFDFFQAVRLLERLMPAARASRKIRQPLARSGALRRASLGYISSQPDPLHHLARDRGPARMTVNFMGLTGPLGVLPHYYTELVISRIRAKDTALRDFFDIFNHRMISLFFQAWQKYRFTVAYERGERDRFSHHLLDLIGLGTEGLQNRQSVPDDSLIYYAGLLAQWPRSASALRQILADYFEVPVEIEQFAGGWFKLDRETQCCFEDGISISEQLGVGAMVGDEIWDQQSRVRVKLGPLTLAQYQDFLPNGTAYEPLCGLLGFFAGAEFDFEVQLILQAGRSSHLRAGSRRGRRAAARLGHLDEIRAIRPRSRRHNSTDLLRTQIMLQNWKFFFGKVNQTTRDALEAAVGPVPVAHPLRGRGRALPDEAAR